MKKIKLFGLFVLAVLLYTSCSSDDDGGGVIDDNINANELLGTWLLVGENINGEDQSLEDCPSFIDFSSNIVTSTEYFGTDCLSVDTNATSYNITDSSIVIEDEGQIFRLDILSLENDVLQIKYEETDIEGDDEFTYIVIETYEKE